MNIKEFDQDDSSMDSDVVNGYNIYDITLKNMGSVYARGLWDLEGNIIRDSSGKYMNLYTTSMRDAFECNQIRCGHCLIPGYRYFFRTQEQLTTFLDERKNGSKVPNKTYCVYYDLDIDFRIPRINHDMARFIR